MIRVAHFLKAIAEFVADGCRTVTTEQYAERLRICQTCRWRTSQTCSLCKCRIALKARGRAFACPDDPPRWPAIPVESSEPGG